MCDLDFHSVPFGGPRCCPCAQTPAVSAQRARERRVLSGAVLPSCSERLVLPLPARKLKRSLGQWQLGGQSRPGSALAFLQSLVSLFCCPRIPLPRVWCLVFNSAKQNPPSPLGVHLLERMFQGDCNLARSPARSSSHGGQHLSSAYRHAPQPQATCCALSVQAHEGPRPTREEEPAST